MDKDAYFQSLNKNDDRFLVIEKYAQANKVPIMQKEGILFLKMLIEAAKVKNILEIGTAIGYSALQFVFVSPDIRVKTIERDEVMYKTALENIKCFNKEQEIDVVFGDALDAKIEGDFDLLFIDAAKGQYQKFFEKYTPFVKKGGLVVTDNLIFHDLVLADSIESKNLRQLVNKIKGFNEWLKHNTGFDTYFYDIGDGIAVSVKKE